MKTHPLIAASLFVIALLTPVAKGDDSPSPPVDSRYAFGLLDHRSRYGEGWFPEPLRGDEGDVDREIRFDYFHSERNGQQSGAVKAELEYNVGLLTLEVEGHYQRDTESSIGSLGNPLHLASAGVGSITFAARHPLLQYVSPDGNFDYTLVAGLEVGVPWGSQISKDTEIVPHLFQLFRFGEHLSVQATAGYSALIGPDQGGHSSFEYNLTLGYNLEREELRLPDVVRTIPIFELSGDTALTRDDAGHNALFGTVGARFNLESVGPAQPRIGIGYVFPIDQGAREELRWGIVTSLVFEY